MSKEQEPIPPLLIKYLITNLQCANCGQHYSLNDVHILGHRNDVWFSRVTCSNCNTQGFILLALRERDASPEIIADVTAEEWAAFQERAPVSADDVLDVHNFLEQFNGDFASLWSREGPDSLFG
ncbi:MAG: hypothetical protein H5T64_07570 [Chloroflexi bacterium]|nr:hypothetical protein [Chloroflexota bacterium]